MSRCGLWETRAVERFYHGSASARPRSRSKRAYAPGGFSVAHESWPGARLGWKNSTRPMSEPAHRSNGVHLCSYSSRGRIRCLRTRTSAWRGSMVNSCPKATFEFPFEIEAGCSGTRPSMSLGPSAAMVLYVTGTTMNTMVLAGFVVALGAVVDDALVDIENIVRRLRDRPSPVGRCDSGLLAPRPRAARSE